MKTDEEETMSDDSESAEIKILESKLDHIMKKAGYKEEINKYLSRDYESTIEQNRLEKLMQELSNPSVNSTNKNFSTKPTAPAYYEICSNSNLSSKINVSGLRPETIGNENPPTPPPRPAWLKDFKNEVNILEEKELLIDITQQPPWAFPNAPTIKPTVPARPATYLKSFTSQVNISSEVEPLITPQSTLAFPKAPTRPAPLPPLKPLKPKKIDNINQASNYEELPPKHRLRSKKSYSQFS